MYDDPSFRLTRVEARHPGASGPLADSVNLVLLACNRNDYDLQLPRVAARLTVAGRVPAAAGAGTSYTLPMRTASEIVVTVPLTDSMVAADQVHRRFDLQGETTVSTPSGDRLVVWKQRGAVWKSGDSLRWVGEQGIACRPGLSQLPSYFTPPPKIEAPAPEAPRDRPDSLLHGRPADPSSGQP